MLFSFSFDSTDFDFRYFIFSLKVSDVLDILCGSAMKNTFKFMEWDLVHDMFMRIIFEYWVEIRIMRVFELKISLLSIYRDILFFRNSEYLVHIWTSQKKMIPSIEICFYENIQALKLSESYKKCRFFKFQDFHCRMDYFWDLWKKIAFFSEI